VVVHEPYEAALVGARMRNPTAGVETASPTQSAVAFPPRVPRYHGALHALSVAIESVENDHFAGDAARIRPP